MTILSQFLKIYRLNFHRNVLYHMKEFFCRKKPNHKKMTLAGFSQRGSLITLMSFHINKTVVSSKISSSDFIKNNLNLFSEDEQRSYGFGTK